jgi:hypothetical protein
MPSSAVDTGFVDEVLPVEQMPERLVEYQLARARGGATTDETLDQSLPIRLSPTRTIC